MIINYTKLGHYEYTDYSVNSDKFWSIKFIKDNLYEVSWGRRHFPPQGVRTINEAEALKRIKDKLRTGYLHKNSPIDEIHKQLWIVDQAKINLEKMLPEKIEPEIKKLKI